MNDTTSMCSFCSHVRGSAVWLMTVSKHNISRIYTIAKIRGCKTRNHSTNRTVCDSYGQRQLFLAPPMQLVIKSRPRKRGDWSSYPLLRILDRAFHISSQEYLTKPAVVYATDRFRPFRDDSRRDTHTTRDTHVKRCNNEFVTNTGHPVSVEVVNVVVAEDVIH